MFTGIIKDVGRIQLIQQEPDQTHINFQTHLDMSAWQIGDSIAVDGCCLTITDKSDDTWRATLSAETLALTHFSHAHIGQAVNLEPALHIGDPLGGHMVTGHIDGIASLDSKTAIGEHWNYVFNTPEKLARYIVKKGSVAVNGVSLTVNEVDGCLFSVNLIPHTLSATNLGMLNAGMQINLETDILGRYVERLMQFGETSATDAIRKDT
ncbi:MAG: riboflavin synthase [Zetaproteobacteria bacterium CG_4_9_14_3_um_filter_49_83]|nr:MAG: riboflavin synthase subunit alpha [Zetaproteobacteria bacterium CG1_02_49_23]PIQ31886.1 MAG: riboflavin synthase [Zetaproteobacteria bacterium CG17_big_fil_post_rev_8_21_14_2_50_50_13]PIV30453.1 MAG: riboflavin synthase [Zetaproteobacteria bacterium CG02_land_8_20_14_3_00_50_9]PIY55419.1 MAG: riboflavin synthase [Zetaproteobacteria bacterium CG_4_10_14_0_8_um_filter_49_80]PJA34566.1 MAG: riboflavin synthase [Zetaproteobacteria bacterium CG_4_9_14_3_um_filter_49_83]